MKYLLIALYLFLEVPVFAGESDWALLPVPQNDASRWLPSTEEAKSAVDGVKEYVAQETAKQKDGPLQSQFAYILDHWNSYYCQIIGVVTQGEKVLVLNFFPRRTTYKGDVDWRKVEVWMLGGGAEYFRVHYDTAQRVFRKVEINAPE